MFHRSRRGTSKPTIHQPDICDEFDISIGSGGGGGSCSSFDNVVATTIERNGTHSDRGSHSIISSCQAHLKECAGKKSRGCVSQQPQPRRTPAQYFICATVIIVLFIIFLHQLDAHIREYQGPLDQLASDILKPYYSMFCPNFSSQQHGIDGANNNDDSSMTNRSLNEMSRTCKSIELAENDDKTDFIMPRMFMIGARRKDEDTFNDWLVALHPRNYSNGNAGSSPDQRYAPRLERINTLEMSNMYALRGGALPNATLIYDNHQHLDDVSTEDKSTMKSGFLCRKMKWEHRLVAVYQTVFSHLLSTYPNDEGFVIIEDDAVLNHPHAFVEEVCNAHNQQLEFYSLYQPPSSTWRGTSRSSPSCIYKHGTVAFYIRQSLMKKIMNERRRQWFCRFPIDMYISRMGPWYATTREVVGHLDTGRVGSVGG